MRVNLKASMQKKKKLTEEKEGEGKRESDDNGGGSQLCPEGKGPRAQAGVSSVTGTGTPGVSGSAEGLESQGEGRQCLNPLLMKTVNRDTLKYW